MAQRHKQKSGGGWSSFTGIANKVIGPAVFLAQLTAKDQSVIASQTTTGGSLKTLANVVTGRITGINVFGDVPKFGQTINPGALINPYSTAAIGGIVAGSVMKKFGIRGGSQIRSLGGKALVPALLGGLFDPPGDVNQSSGASIIAANVYHPGNVGHNTTVVAGYTSQNRGYGAQASLAGGAVSADIIASSM